MSNVLSIVETILQYTVLVCMVGIGLSLVLLTYRIVVGPSNPDRAAALDVLGICVIASAALTSILVVTIKLNDVILLVGILSFIGTLAIAKYIEMGVIIERNSD